MTTPIRIEVGLKTHTWDIPWELTDAEERALLKALSLHGRNLQVWLMELKKENHMAKDFNGLAPTPEE